MPPRLEKSSKAATRLSRELLTDIDMENSPLMELLSLARVIYAKI